jgi:chitinase
MKNLYHKSLLCVSIIFLWSFQLRAQFRVVGYMPSWAGDVANIQYSKVTHINYSFLLPTSTGGLQSIDNPSKLQSLVSRGHAAGVKVSIAVGGWNGGDDSAFEQLAANSTYRNNFVNNLINFVNQYGLDGVDMDWEYPDGGASSNNYSLLMQQLSTALHSRGKILTAAVVASGGSSIQNNVFGYVDFLNLMAYDGGGSNHSTYEYAESSLNYWIGRGLPANKAVLGVPFYGRSPETAYNTLLANGASSFADSFNGIGYNGITTIKRKTNLAFDRAGGGIMIWELSQDVNNQNSLLSAINEVVIQRGTGTVPSNLAKGKSVTVSSNESGTANVAANAVDGSYSSRWSSAYSDNQWIRVDLGTTYNVNRVKISWENAYATSYRIEISSDGTNWSAVRNVTKSSPSADDFGSLTATGRYLRIYGVTRGTSYGFSIWEIEAYGTPAGGGGGNLALGKSVVTTTNELASLSGANAVDGNGSTRWSSQYVNNQNFIVDLGTNYSINRIKIVWETAYARDYQIQVSTDNVSWRTVREFWGKPTSVADDYTGMTETARWVKVYCVNRATPYGFSIYEFEVYGTNSGTREMPLIAQPENNLSAFPNPVAGTLTVEIPEQFQKETRLNLYNISGKKIASDEVKGTSHSIDMSNLNSGMYIIQLSNKTGRRILKVLKE